MLVEVAALLLQACSTLKGSAAAAFYIRHRTSCILLLQSIEFAANLAYIPRAFALNVAIQLGNGKFHSVFWNSLVSGCASFNVALHCLSMRLPVHIAAPFAAAKAAAALALLPQHVAYLSMPQINGITLDVKRAVDTAYNTALGLCFVWAMVDVGLAAAVPQYGKLAAAT
ncbi:hypothetical protein OEZ86_000926 [Tetradesmus obliquus]|nr:hypothetical protein OEZ86_000926 [Tetradesmus obliquus]